MGDVVSGQIVLNAVYTIPDVDERLVWPSRFDVMLSNRPMDNYNMIPVVISGSGVYTPPHCISNEELVTAYNAYVQQWNQSHADAIARGEVVAKPESSAEFIEKASGIKSRYVNVKDGILDPSWMRPRIPERSNDELSLQGEMAVNAACVALSQAHCEGKDIDFVLVAASAFARPFPALAIEVQQQIGASGYAFDMNVACSSATFAIKTAVDAVKSGSAKRVLVVNPELGSAVVNFCDRDSHFIFGDVATAVIIERADAARSTHQFEILGHKLVTQFSNNIRSNAGVLDRLHPESRDNPDKMFVQEGRKVFKEVCPMVAELIQQHLGELNLTAAQLKRLWLHQANINMNRLIASKVLGREASEEEAPLVLDRYSNTGSAGSIIAFHFYRDGFEAGELGLLCSFGAGYSVGVLTLRRR